MNNQQTIISCKIRCYARSFTAQDVFQSISGLDDILRLRWTSCVRLFIIIFIDVYSKFEYIPTVTNFASILVNCLYFLWKTTALRPSELNFWGRIIEFWQKSSEKKKTCQKMALLVTVYGEWYSKFYCAHILSGAWKLPSTRPRYLR